MPTFFNCQTRNGGYGFDGYGYGYGTGYRKVYPYLYPCPTLASVIHSLGFQRFYNLESLKKMRKNLETSLAGNSSPFRWKLNSKNIYRNLGNLKKPLESGNVSDCIYTYLFNINRLGYT